MVNIVCVGQRTTGVFGMYVAKGGFNVLTCADKDLLLSTDLTSAQVIYDTTVSYARYVYNVGVTNNLNSYIGRKTITHPNFGMVPFILVQTITNDPSWGDGLYTPRVFDQTATSFAVPINATITGQHGSSPTYFDQFTSYSITMRIRAFNVENTDIISWATWIGTTQKYFNY